MPEHNPFPGNGDIYKTFREITAPLRRDPVFMGRISRAHNPGRLYRLQETYSRLGRWQKISLFSGGMVLAMTVAGATVLNGMEGRKQEVAEAKAKMLAEQTVLFDPWLRAQTGTCNEELRQELGYAINDPYTYPGAAEIRVSLSQPSSAEVPCEPISPDGSYTTVIKGIPVTVTEADLLPHLTRYRLHSQSPVVHS